MAWKCYSCGNVVEGMDETKFISCPECGSEDIYLVEVG